MVLIERLKKDGFRYLVHAAALAPLALMVWDYWQGRFLVDLVREVTARTGQTAIKLLILALACTPLSIVFGFREALKVRRALGLYAFLYASLHFVTFIWLDYGLNLAFIVDAVVDQRFVWVGLAALLVMVPLAITSSRGWMKRLGKRWKLLHRLVYGAGVLAVLHYLLLVKDIREPSVYAAILIGLLGVRVGPVRRFFGRVRHRVGRMRSGHRAKKGPSHI